MLRTDLRVETDAVEEEVLVAIDPIDPTDPIDLKEEEEETEKKELNSIKPTPTLKSQQLKPPKLDLYANLIFYRPFLICVFYNRLLLI